MPPYSPQSTAPRPPPRRFVASLVLGGTIGPAPGRVRLWNPGENPWDGDPQINLTRSAAERVIAAFVERGNMLSMDINHAQSIEEQRAKAEAARTGQMVAPRETQGAGYCALELVETPDGPAIDFLPRWARCSRDAIEPGDAICCAAHWIEAGKLCQFSPDWLGDETTGEPIRVNRISLVGDGAMHGIGLLASRQLAGRSGAEMAEDPMAAHRAMYKGAAAMAAGEDPDGKKLGEAMCAHLKAHAAALGIDLEKEPDGDEPKKPEQAAAAPAESAPLPKPEEPKQAAAAAALASRPAAQAQPLTMAGVLAHLADRDQLVALLDANKDRIGEKTRHLLASQGLAQTRAFIETLSPRPVTDAGTGGDTGGAVLPAAAGKAHRRPLTEGQAYLANRISAALEITPERAAEFEKAPGVTYDELGRACHEFSMVALVKTQRAARIASTRGALR